MKILTILILAFFATLSFAASAAEAVSDLSWTAPATRVDGTPLAQSEIAEYRLYYAVDTEVTGDETPVVISNTATMDTVTLTLDPRAENYVVSFALTTVDTEGRESVLSDPVSKTFVVKSTAAPSAPTSLQVTITCGSGCTIQQLP
jgi:hypothetical protein